MKGGGQKWRKVGGEGSGKATSIFREVDLGKVERKKSGGENGHN